MDARVARLEAIRKNISVINFCDHLTYEDYDRINQLERERAAIKETLIGYKGVVCKVTPSYNKNSPFYLTGDRIICCGESPTYFESEEEAREFYAKSDLANSGYEVEYYESIYE